MKKTLIVLGTLVLLFVAFFAGFSLGLDSMNKSQEDALEVVETDSVDNEETHELKAELDMIFLANLMLKEKTTKQLNDAPYVAYLVDSLGFALVEMFPDEWWRLGRKEFEGGGMKLCLISELNNNGHLLREIHIKGLDGGRCMFELIQFGLRRTEGEGAFADYKGKGLFAGIGPESVSVGCWFDEK